MKLTLFKAQRTQRDKPTEDLVIEAHEEFPDLAPEKTLDDLRGLHDRQGKWLADALINHLSGGTVDATLRYLLQHRASLLIVKW